jgi:hypothetical protein
MALHLARYDVNRKDSNVRFQEASKAFQGRLSIPVHFASRVLQLVAKQTDSQNKFQWFWYKLATGTPSEKVCIILVAAV